MNLLIAAPEAADADVLAERLRSAGLRLAGACACRNLVREAVRLAPDAVVLRCAQLDAHLLAQLQLLADGLPLPVLVASDGPPPADAAALRSAQVWAWLPADCPPPWLAAQLAVVQARWAAQRAAEQALAGALARLDERKWIDRAKGVLMQHQQLSEDDAFALLRQASMQANLRVGEVSRGLIEAAQAADAVNRAGQLRMLSQRTVRVLAQLAAGIDPAAGSPLLADSLDRLQANLDQLGTPAIAAAAADPLQAARSAGAALRALAQGLGPSRLPDTATLAQADQTAERLLRAADDLTAALESASGRRSLQVVNICGRQRMLTQRLAKQALLAALLPGEQADAQAQAAAQTLAEFEAGLQHLERAPLVTDGIRAALAQARGEWQRMLQALRRGASRPAGEALAPLASESEALLTSFEHLTSLYEHSLQVLLG